MRGLSLLEKRRMKQMRKASMFRATTKNLRDNDLFIRAYEASLEDGSIDFSGNAMKYVFVDEATKELIKQYEPSYTFGEKETFHVKHDNAYMDLYGTGSGIEIISFAEELLMLFRQMKAYVQGYFEKELGKENALVQKIYAWGGEEVKSAPTDRILAEHKITMFMYCYTNVNDYDTQARKVVDKIQVGYPFDTALLKVLH